MAKKNLSERIRIHEETVDCLETKIELLSLKLQAEKIVLQGLKEQKAKEEKIDQEQKEK